MWFREALHLEALNEVVVAGLLLLNVVVVSLQACASPTLCRARNLIFQPFIKEDTLDF